MPRLTAEERESISKVDQWIAAGGGQAPVQPGGAPMGTQRTSGQQSVRRAGVGPPRVKGNGHPQVRGPEAPAASPPAAAGAAACRRKNAVPNALARQGDVLDASAVPGPLGPADGGDAGLWAPQMAGAPLHGISDFVTGVAALLSVAGTDAVKSLAQQALCGPVKTTAITDPSERKASERIEAYDGAGKTAERPQSSAKERQPLAVWSSARLSSTNSSALDDFVRVGARRKEPPADLPRMRAKQPSAKARRVSAIF